MTLTVGAARFAPLSPTMRGDQSMDIDAVPTVHGFVGVVCGLVHFGPGAGGLGVVRCG